MKTRAHTHLRDLIDRLARLAAADAWTDELNPTQHAALSYLTRANRFSRAPSHVADYLSATRGTVSQTLKALARKKMIVELRSETDRRSISYAPTAAGEKALSRSALLEEAFEQLPANARKSVTQGLEDLIRAALSVRGQKQFGMCRACRHHQKRKSGGYCNLLDVELKPAEVTQICHEYEDAA